MEMKKSQQLAKPADNARDTGSGGVRLWEFFGEVKAEFKKISWTSSEELKAYTKIVVIATLLLGMGIYLIDLVIQFSLNALSFLVRLIS
jgi:preprotein translocase subunit SecE